MYCINYAINLGSYSKIAETLLPMTVRKGSGKVWEEHDKILGGGGRGVELLKTTKPSDP